AWTKTHRSRSPRLDAHSDLQNQPTSPHRRTPRAGENRIMNDPTSLRRDLRHWLRLRPSAPRVEVEVVAVDIESLFERRRVSYRGPDGDSIPAFLLVPQGLRKPTPAVLVHHQHNGERHVGKSEVCGLIGDPLQAFGPALAERGCIVLAPDSICFEDRRRGRAGTDSHPDD